MKIFERGVHQVRRSEASANIVDKNLNWPKVCLHAGGKFGRFALVAQVGHVCPNIYPCRPEFAGSLVQLLFTPCANGDIYAFCGECKRRLATESATPASDEGYFALDSQVHVLMYSVETIRCCRRPIHGGSRFYMCSKNLDFYPLPETLVMIA